MRPKSGESGCRCANADRICVYDHATVANFFRQQRWDPYAWKRLAYALFAQGLKDDVVWQKVPARFRESCQGNLSLHCLEMVERHESAYDGATKFVFRTRNGDLIEAVAMKAKTGRTTACVSSQVGCAAKCTFCATARMDLRQQLSACEILDQVTCIRQHFATRGMRLRNVVLMGMGEPLHNESAVYAALDALQAVDRFSFSPKRIMLSSIGVPQAVERFANRFPQIGFALSLHAVQQPLREQLIPLARLLPLSSIRNMLELLLASGRSVMIEYLMLHRVNDAEQDAFELAHFLRGLRVHINLIPWNPIVGTPWSPSPRDRRDRFAKVLRESGFLTTIRYSQGNDIAAACGQLVTSRQNEDQSDTSVPVR